MFLVALLSLRQDASGRHSLCSRIGPEKPRNSAVFRGWLCTLDWGCRLGITPLSARPSLPPFTWPIRYHFVFDKPLSGLADRRPTPSAQFLLAGRDSASKQMIASFQPRTEHLHLDWRDLRHHNADSREVKPLPSISVRLIFRGV